MKGGCTGYSSSTIDRQMAVNHRQAPVGCLTASQHRSEAARIRAAAAVLHCLPEMAWRYQELALSHELAAARQESMALANSPQH